MPSPQIRRLPRCSISSRCRYRISRAAAGPNLAEAEFGMHVEVTAQGLGVRKKFARLREEVGHVCSLSKV